MVSVSLNRFRIVQTGSTVGRLSPINLILFHTDADEVVTGRLNSNPAVIAVSAIYGALNCKCPTKDLTGVSLTGTAELVDNMTLTNTALLILC